MGPGWNYPISVGLQYKTQDLTSLLHYCIYRSAIQSPRPDSVTYCMQQLDITYTVGGAHNNQQAKELLIWNDNLELAQKAPKQSGMFDSFNGY